MSSLTIGDAGPLLDTFRVDLAPILAENGQSFDRLRSTFMIAVQQNPEILKCSADSLRREISKCAVDGLVPDSKEAVLLPYYDSKEKLHLANYQPMVYGIIKRMKELGSVFNIVCELVCQNDTFSFNAADPDSLSHSWDVLSETPRGATRAAYVIFRDDQKRVMHREIMTLSELQAVRAASKAPNSPAWRNFEGEMYQKAVLRRGSKYISTNNDKIRMLIERQDTLFDFGQPRAAERIDPFSGKTIDLPPQDAPQSLPRAQDTERSSSSSPTTRRADGGADATRPEAKASFPPAPSVVPEVDLAPMDIPKAMEAVTAILAVPLNENLDAKGCQDALREEGAARKAATPEYLHPLLKACIDMSNWAVKAAVDGRAWAADHAMFAQKVAALLGIERLNIGKYP